MTLLVSLEKQSVSGPLSWRSALMINIQSQAFFALLNWRFSAGYHHFNRHSWSQPYPKLPVAYWWGHQLRVWMVIHQMTIMSALCSFFLVSCELPSACNVVDFDKLSADSPTGRMFHLSASLVSCTEDLVNMALCEGISNCLYLWQ